MGKKHLLIIAVAAAMVGVLLTVLVVSRSRRFYYIPDTTAILSGRTAKIECTDYMMEYTVERGEAVNIGDSWFIKLLETDTQAKRCKMVLYNESVGVEKNFQGFESSFVIGLQEFGREGLRIAEINDDSVVFETRWGEVKMEYE